MRSRPFARLFVVAVAMAMTAPVLAQSKAFPDEWFFEAEKRPAPLKGMEGKPAAELDVASWIGDATTIKDNKGKVIVLDFWATWCGPCMASIPENVKLVSEHKGKDLVFIGIHDGNSGSEKAAGVVKSKGINYPIAIDKKRSPLSVTAAAYKVQFWPTYVVIDKAGTVRGAGLIPNRVADAVKVLLAEPGPKGGETAAGASEFPDESYLGGKMRSKALMAMEGKPMPSLDVETWSAGGSPPESAFKGVVTVIHFTSTRTAARKELEAFGAAAAEFGSQSATFVAVCDPASHWDKMQEALASLKITTPAARDAKAESKADGKQGAADDKNAKGRTAAAFNASLQPTTFVIDRKGIVRAAGLKAGSLKPVLEKLLAEPAPGKPAAK
ncbi:MAG: redoxin domain-containing protein [Phycisphaerae bacterium]|jgi:thiol-disulfide isomerase/thioredoxin